MIWIILASILISGVEWLFVCGVVALICALVPSFVFSWGNATAVWLVLTLCQIFFTGGKHDE